MINYYDEFCRASEKKEGKKNMDGSTVAYPSLQRKTARRKAKDGKETVEHGKGA